MIFRAQRLEGKKILLPFPSVGATENGILAAVLADGVTVLKGCAREPEIIELCSSLKKRGAQIKAADGIIYVKGADKLQDVEQRLRPDRIVAGTYLLAACAARGNIVLHDMPEEELQSLTELLESMGGYLQILEENGRKTMKADCRFLKRRQIHVKTAPYPGFPTDLQSQLMATEAVREGDICCIREEMFEKRFLIVEELRKMGADICMKGSEVQIYGKDGLHGADLKVKDLRGGAALILAALAAEGTSRIAPDGHIKRGYENMSRDLEELGARIHTEEDLPGELPVKE